MRPACLALLAAPAAAAYAQDAVAPHVARVRELWHLTDRLGEDLWPGFTTREVPIAVNVHDRRELLFGHPDPPSAYRALEGHPGVLVRDGVSRYGPRGGGWAVDLGGCRVAYVGVSGAGQSTERYLSLLLHECFHVYQRRYREAAAGRRREPVWEDPAQAAMIGLESRVLHAAVRAGDVARARELARTFVAVRRERRAGLPPEVVRAEGEMEYGEGTATYVQARLFQLLATSGGIDRVGDDDPEYRGFADAARGYEEYLARIAAPPGLLITSMHLRYNVGMGQCLLLDRVRPGWKQEMRARGHTQFELLERAFPVAAEQAGELVAEARRRFGYDGLLAEQTALVEARLAEIRSFLAGPGRRYRVYHGVLAGSFRWKPRGPVYRVPASLLAASDRRIAIRRPRGRVVFEDPDVTVWAGGIRRFEKGGLLFASEAVPVLFRPDYLEWIDRDPAADGSDLVIESDREEDGVHHGLRLRTDGFTLRAPRARVERAGGVVTIRPLAGG